MSAGGDVASITVTLFYDKFATDKDELQLPLSELAQLIEQRTAPTKTALPWLKLAAFGNLPTEKDSLRWDGNVLTITGIEADYDGEKVSLDEAVEIAEKAGVAAIIYTSPSHTPGKPRWRVLCPTRRSLAPQRRIQLVDRLNGLYGGIFAAESWALSQSYYFGSVNNNPNHRVEILEGQPIDELDELDLIAIGKPATQAGGNGVGRTWTGKTDEAVLLAQIVSGKSYHTAAIRLLGVWAHQKMPMLEAERRLRAAFEGVFPPDRDARWRDRVSEIPKLLEHVWGKEAGKTKADSPREETPLENGKDFEMKKIDWLWKGWIARGKFHLLAGSKSAGKSTIAFDLMAAITSRGKWPDGSPAPLGDVLVWSGEDDIADTILPRFVAAGGDRKRIYFVRTVIDNGIARPFDPSTDMMGLIERAATLPNLLLIMIDPVVLAIPSKADSHKNAETRRGLQPLVDFSETLKIALIGITHFTKGTFDQDPIERVTGSLAFAALARIVLGTSADEDGLQRRLVRIASNIGPSGGGIEYTLYQAPLPDHDFTAQRIAWGNILTGAPRDLLSGNRRSAEADASGFLTDFLKDGEHSAKDVKEAADAHGHSWATIRRAQQKLGIKPKQISKKWIWELPQKQPEPTRSWGMQ